MAAKVTNCYRFANVDFEPQTRLLIWQDSAMTILTEDECRLLNVLCCHAGETLSIQALFDAARLPSTSFEQHINNLNSLLEKSYHSEKKQLPIEVVGDHGYRIALPKKTFAKKNEQLIAVLDPSFMTAKQPDRKSSSFSNRKKLTLAGLLTLLLMYLALLLYHFQ